MCIMPVSSVQVMGMEVDVRLVVSLSIDMTNCLPAIRRIVGSFFSSGSTLSPG